LTLAESRGERWRNILSTIVIETEIKLRWPRDADSARSHIEAHGYAAMGPRLLEADQLFDRPAKDVEGGDVRGGYLPGGELRASGQVLRLRLSGGEATVTYKGPVEASGPYKSREEIEFIVDDPAAFELVLARLGYRRGFRYEKFRTKFRAADEAQVGEAGQGIVTLDETPMGVFIELEGAEYWINAAAERLGFTRNQFISASYATLYNEFRVSQYGLPTDMVFAKSRE
jgi:adenylate cyclase class 2